MGGAVSNWEQFGDMDRDTGVASFAWISSVVGPTFLPVHRAAPALQRRVRTCSPRS